MIYTIQIRDETEKLIFYDEFVDIDQFYLETIDNDTKYLSFGGAKSKGKGFIESICKWAQEWAQEQDLDGFYRELCKILIEESIKSENIQAQNYLQTNRLHITTDKLRSIMVNVQQEVADDFIKKYGRKVGFVVFHMTCEMLLAMVNRLENASRMVYTVWEFPSSALGKDQVEAILEWLFKRR